MRRELTGRKDLRGIVLRGDWGGRGFGVRELEKWGSNMRRNVLEGKCL